MIDLGNLAQWGGAIIATIALIRGILSDRKKNNSAEIDTINKAVSQIKGELGTRAGKGSVETLERRTRATEEAITKINTEFTHLPNKEMMHKLEMGMAEIKGFILTLTATVKQSEVVSERLQEFLLKQAERKNEHG